MIKQDLKSRFPKDPTIQNKSPKSNTSKSTSKKKVTPSHKSRQNETQSNNQKKQSKYSKHNLKENKPVNQNTPKRSKICRGDLNMSDERLEEIKFISKQCSSIKQNNNQCISFSNSGHNLDEFSPLFDKMQKDNSKGDFTLQIYAIEDLQSFYQIKNPVQYSNEKVHRHNVNSSNGKSGRIKKNKILSTISSQKPKNASINSYILQIFKTLDHGQSHILSKQNCSSQKLTTQLNYLIGSILNKIKVKGKQYDYQQFENQFKSLIDDSQIEQILQILNNQRKRTKTNKSLATQNQQLNQEVPIKEHRQSPIPKKPHTKQDGVAQKLNKISNKLNQYLAKNNLDKAKEDRKNADLQKQNDKQNSHSNIKNSDLKTTATQNSKVSQAQQSISKSKIKANIELIKRIDGSMFQLYFSELNKHLD